MSLLGELERRNPEWRPWLDVIGEVLAADARAWEAAVPPAPAQRHALAPLLARAVVDLDGAAASGLLDKLMRAAGYATRGMAEGEAREVFRSALNRDEHALKCFALDAQVNPEAFRAVAFLLPVPFLHACRHSLGAAQPRAWAQGYCPLCGAWAAFAELCGVERLRYLRCGECGSAWPAHRLSCPYCGLTDHEALGSLVPEQDATKGALDVCTRCLGYLKVFTRLSVCAPEVVMLENLASVELDLAALARGYRRPAGPGCALGVNLVGDDG